MLSMSIFSAGCPLLCELLLVSVTSHSSEDNRTFLRPPDIKSLVYCKERTTSESDRGAYLNY